MEFVDEKKNELTDEKYLQLANDAKTISDQLSQRSTHSSPAVNLSNNETILERLRESQRVFERMISSSRNYHECIAFYDCVTRSQMIFIGDAQIRRHVVEILHTEHLTIEQSDISMKLLHLIILALNNYLESLDATTTKELFLALHLFHEKNQQKKMNSRLLGCVGTTLILVGLIRWFLSK